MNNNVGTQIKRLALFCLILGVLIACVVAFWFMDLWIDTERSWYIFLALFSLIVLVFLSYLVFIIVYSWGSVVVNVERIKTKVYGETRDIDDFPVLKKITSKKEDIPKEDAPKKNKPTPVDVQGLLNNLYSLKLLMVAEYSKALDLFISVKGKNKEVKEQELLVFNSELLKLKKEYDDKKVSESFFNTKRSYLVKKYLEV